jgi:hypothetical protein
MGSLDDAIREHLELKRLRGADPSEVEREEREALSAPLLQPEAGDGLAAVDFAADDDEREHEHEQEQVQGEQAGAQPPEALAEPQPRQVPAAAERHETEPPHAGGETAEIDMLTVLEGKGDDATAEKAEDAVDEDQLEWEQPEPAVPDAREAAPAASAGEEQPEVVEDVLEETPDFLRETPEQERLWFEQQPPRDFDFDK